MSPRLRFYTLLFFIAGLLSGCTNYVQVFETEPLPHAAPVPYENDALRVELNFWEHHGGMALKITNVSDQPIYPNWNTSAYTLGKTIHGYPAQHRLPGMIPPGETVVVNEFVLWMGNILPYISNMPMEKRKIAQYNRKTWSANFTRNSTPQTFGHLLTYCLTPDCDEPFTIEHEFFISKVVQLRASDFRVLSNLTEKGYQLSVKLQQPNQFYVYQLTPEQRAARAEAGMDIALGLLMLAGEIAAAASDANAAGDNDDNNNSSSTGCSSSGRSSGASKSRPNRSNSPVRVNQGRSRTVAD